jgi:hypothetical protein
MLANAYVEGNQIKVKAWFLTPHTIGRCEEGSNLVTVADASGFLTGQSVLLAGAGPEGEHLATTISSIAGSVVTIAASATTRVKWTAFGKLTDPTTITFKVERPVGTIDTYTAPHAAITSPQAGIYVLTYDPASDGTYPYRVEGTGAAKGAAEGAFRIIDSELD